MQKIAEVVGEVGVYAADQRVPGEIAVLPEGDFPEQEIADGVGAELVDQKVRVHHVAFRLRHLVAVHDQPAVAVNLLRQRQVEGHQDRGPDDGMEANDLLADEMHVRRPELLEFLRVVEEARRRHVVRQRVKPDVDHVLLVVRHGNAPIEGRAGNAEVVEPLLDEADHLVAPGGRPDEIGIFLDMLEQTVGVVRQLEEIRLLGHLLHRTVTVRAAAVLVQLQLRPVAFAGRAVESSVFAFVNVALRLGAAEEFLHHAMMARLAGAQEVVVGDMEPLPKRLEARDNLIHVFDGRHAFLFGGLLDLLPVLVAAGQEEYVVPRQALEPRHGVGNRRAVSVPDMQFRARIINRRRYVKRFIRHENSLLYK